MRKLLLSIATAAIAGMPLLARHVYAAAVPADEQPDPTVTTVTLTNLSELTPLYPAEEGTADFTVEYTGQLAIVAVQGSYLWLTDLQGSFIQTYSRAYDRDYSCGEVVAGFKGVPTNYRGKYQITDAVIGEYLPDEGIKAVEPVKTGIAEITPDMQNRYVLIEDVAVVKNLSRNYTITDAGASLTMYDTYSNITGLYPVEGHLYNVRGLVDVYNGQVQIVPLEVWEELSERPLSGIAAADIEGLFPTTENTTGEFIVKYDSPLVVAGQAGVYLWLTDMDGHFISLYAGSGHSYEKGRTVAGFSGVPTNHLGRSVFSNPKVGEYVEGTGVKEITPQTVTCAGVSGLDEWQYVQIDNANVSHKDGDLFLLTEGDGTLGMYDWLGIPKEAGRVYHCSVRAFVGRTHQSTMLFVLGYDMHIGNLSDLDDYYPDMYGEQEDFTVDYRKQLTVVASVGKNLWLTDEQGGFVYLYGVNWTCKAGDVVAGFSGVPSNYRGTYEIKNACVGDVVAEAGTRTIVPEEIVIEDVVDTPQAHYVLLRGVEISGKSRRYTLSDGVSSAIMYDQTMTFLDFVPEDGCRYDVLGFIGAYYIDGPEVFPLSVTVQELQVCAAPEFTPTPGEYKGVTAVMATSATEGATIYFTVNGGEPDENSATFSTPVELDESGIYEFRAVAMADGYAPSEVVTVVYDLDITSGTVGVRVAGDEDFEYFNLQGMRVADPVRGIYIGRRDGKVVKHVVK